MDVNLRGDLFWVTALSILIQSSLDAKSTTCFRYPSLRCTALSSALSSIVTSPYPGFLAAVEYAVHSFSVLQRNRCPFDQTAGSEIGVLYEHDIGRY